jgi:hypothetical protein
VTQDNLLFDWEIPIAGGITKAAFVLAVKRFCDLPYPAIEEYGADLIE